MSDSPACALPPRNTRFRVEGMDCASCATRIGTALERLPGVAGSEVSVGAGTMTVTHDARSDAAAIRARVEALGYRATVIADEAGVEAGAAPGRRGNDHAHDHGTRDDGATHGHHHDHATDAGRPWWATGRARLTLACALALALAWVLGRLVPALETPLFIAAVAVGLVPIAWRAVVAARYGSPFTIETLMTIAAIGAIIIGAAEEAGAVVVLFLLGEMLEGVAAGRARASIAALTELVPRTALRLQEDGSVAEVDAATLVPGDTLLVRPGERIAADGIVIEGAAAIDESPVTGESVPRQHHEGEAVFAGTIVLDAALHIRASAGAQDNTIARVVRLVEEAQESKAPTERFIDRLSRFYTPAVLVAGALVTVVPPLALGGEWCEWIYKGLALLLIGCPCALVISTPAAIAAGLATGARQGLLMKGGAVLERFRTITTVAFDKTGTLTAGMPVVTDVVPLASEGRELVARAAALETGSSHPLARAILARAEAEGVAIPAASAIRAIDGKGVAGSIDGVAVQLVSPAAARAAISLTPAEEARIDALTGEGKTVAVLIDDGQAAGLIAMRDEPRADAAPAIRRLSEMGIRALMLTGDNARTAEAVGRSLGLEVRAGLLPADKMAIVRSLQEAGEVVAKVGDGINDAPALAAADVGVAMGGGTDVALETAEAASLHGRVADIPRMVELSRHTMANIRQNITVALGMKALFVVTTLAGLTGLWPAILADTGATVLVTANAMRLLALRLR